MPKTTVYRTLPVTLSKDDIAKRAAELASKELEKTRIEEQKKAVGAPLAGLKLAIQRLSKTVDTGIEEQDVACDEIYDDDRFEKRVVRKDTGAEIERHPYTASERAECRQEPLPFEVEVEDLGKLGRGKKNQKTLFDEKPVKVGPRDATPSPDRVDHKGQSLTKVDRSKKNGRGKGKRGEARA